MRPDGTPGLLIVPEGFHPERSLGWQLVHWMETLLCHGPGDLKGERLVLDDEFTAHLVMAYGLDEDGRRLVTHDVLSRPKGRAKSEIAGGTGCAEGLGPVRFDHWAKRGETSWWGYEYQPGEPVGRLVRSPLIRMLATEEGQAGNTYDNVQVMLVEGAIADHFDGIDTGVTRTFLPDSGEIRPCTAGAASKDGGKESFAVADETHLYVLPELKSMHATTSRNATKRKAAEPWMLDTTTMFAEGQGSVAEEQFAHAALIAAGKVRNRGLLFDHKCGGIPDDVSDELWNDDAYLIEHLRLAYGSASEWMDIERIVGEIRRPATTRKDARRYFFNQPTKDDDESWLPSGAWDACRREKFDLDPLLPTAVGVDMALKHDSIAVVAAQLRPDTNEVAVKAWVWEPGGVKVDVADVENTLRALHRDCTVTQGFGYDPAYFERSAQVLEDEGLLMVEFPQSNVRMVAACQDTYGVILNSGNKKLQTLPSLVHDADPDSPFTRQVIAAVPRATGEGWRLSKGKAKKKIDASIALVMALWLLLHNEPEEDEGTTEFW